MSDAVPPTAFAGKKWILIAQVIFCGFLGLSFLPIGVLAALGRWTNANGGSAADAAPWILGCSTCITLVFASRSVQLFRIFRRPRIAIYREGIEIRMIGMTSLDHVPFIPVSIRVAFEVLSLQGFRLRSFFIAWQDLESANVYGFPMSRTLRIEGRAVERAPTVERETKSFVFEFKDAELKRPLDKVQEAILRYQRELRLRGSLKNRPAV